MLFTASRRDLSAALKTVRLPGQRALTHLAAAAHEVEVTTSTDSPQAAARSAVAATVKKPGRCSIDAASITRLLSRLNSDTLTVYVRDTDLAVTSPDIPADRLALPLLGTDGPPTIPRCPDSLALPSKTLAGLINRVAFAARKPFPGVRIDAGKKKLTVSATDCGQIAVASMPAPDAPTWSGLVPIEVARGWAAACRTSRTSRDDTLFDCYTRDATLSFGAGAVSMSAGPFVSWSETLPQEFPARWLTRCMGRPPRAVTLGASALRASLRRVLGVGDARRPSVTIALRDGRLSLSVDEEGTGRADVAEVEWSEPEEWVVAGKPLLSWLESVGEGAVHIGADATGEVLLGRSDGGSWWACALSGITRPTLDRALSARA